MKFSFETFTEILSLHIFTMLMLFLRVNKFTNHVIYRNLAHNQFSSQFHPDDFQDVRFFFKNEYMFVNIFLKLWITSFKS